MSTMLDTTASRAVYAARLFERAVHDVGPWFIECGGERFTARRTKTDTQVLFSADLPALSPGPTRISLYCRDEMVSVRSVAVGEESNEGFCIDWAVELVPAA